MRLTPRAGRERGAALIWTILLMIVVAGLVAAFVMVAQRAGERSNDAARRVANTVTVQTAVTRILYGFQNDHGSESDFYTLDAADLTEISGRLGSGARVVPASRFPAQYRLVFGVWEHRDGPHRLVRLGGVPSDVVEESIAADPGACRAARLPPTVCQSGGVRAYWQVVRVVMPDTTGEDSGSVVLVVRTWLGSLQTRSFSKASYARVEMRPGRFADFQLISDGNMRFGRRAVINGPVHSNGFADGSFATVHDPPGASAGSSWVYLERGVNCAGRASITIRTGRIYGPGETRNCNDQGSTGQTISFLRAIDSIDAIRDARGVWSAPASRRGNQWGRHPYETAWRVQMLGDRMRIDYPDGTPHRTVSLGRVNAFLFDEDVRVRGNVSANRRVTIAARRGDAASASIFIDGDIRKGNDQTTSIGLIAHGDVVLWQTPSRPCTASIVQAAIVAATGGVTIPSRYTTDELQEGAPACSRPILLDGSIAGHRPPTLYWRWDSGEEAGFIRARTYRWDEQLKRNPPPHFPLTGTWQASSVRNANVDCLYVPAQLANPRCR